MKQALKLQTLQRIVLRDICASYRSDVFFRYTAHFVFFALSCCFTVLAADRSAAEDAEASAVFSDTLSPGIKHGNTTILPMAYMGITYDSNLYKTENNPDADFKYLARPTIDIFKRMPTITWTGSFGADIEKYNEHSEDDNVDFFAKSGLVKNVNARTTFFSNAQIKRDQDPSSVDNVDIPDDLAEPVTSLLMEGSVGVQHRPTRNTTLTFMTGYSYTDYDDVLDNTGTLVDQDFRDEGIVTSSAQIDIMLSRYLFFKTVGDLDVHEIRGQDFFLDRDYTEWKVEESTIISLSPKLLTELIAGIKKQDFHDDAAADSDLLKKYGARAEWKPTQRITLQLAGIYEDLGVDFEEGISSGYKTEYEFSVNYKLRRNLSFNQKFMFRDSVIGLEKFDEDLFSYNFKAQYDINRQWAFSLDYLYEDQESERPGNTYDRNEITASINWRY